MGRLATRVTHWQQRPWQQFPKDEGRCEVLGWALCLLCVSAVSVTHGGPTKETVGHLEGGERAEGPPKNGGTKKNPTGCNARGGSKLRLLQSLANSVPGPAANRESKLMFSFVGRWLKREGGESAAFSP